MTDERWATLWLIIVIFAFALIWTFIASIAHARDFGQWDRSSELSKWYQTLMQPDNPAVSCCGEADAYFCDDYRYEKGKALCTISDDRPDEPRHRPHVEIGTVIEIPNHKLKFDQGNPTEHGVVFLSTGMFVYCFVAPGGV